MEVIARMVAGQSFISLLISRAFDLGRRNLPPPALLASPPLDSADISRRLPTNTRTDFLLLAFYMIFA